MVIFHPISGQSGGEGRKHSKFSAQGARGQWADHRPQHQAVAEGQPGSSRPHVLPLLAIPAQSASRVIPERCVWRVAGVCSLMLVILPGSPARCPRGQALLGLDLGLAHHESFVSGQLSDFIQITGQSLSSRWVTLDLPRQDAGWQKSLQLGGGERSLRGGTGGSGWTCLASLHLVGGWISCRRR